MIRGGGEQTIKTLVRRGQRRERLVALYAAGPAAVFAGLRLYARGQTRRDGQPYNEFGWASHAFREIFGTEPRPQDRRVDPETTPDSLLDLIREWVPTRKKKPRRIKLEKPAPLLDRVEKELRVGEDGFLEGTLMTVGDLEEEWR
jgi:hypothetical protein